jgi:hypothetical protein
MDSDNKVLYISLSDPLSLTLSNSLLLSPQYSIHSHPLTQPLLETETGSSSEVN